MNLEVAEMGFDPGRLGLCPSDVSASKKNVLLGCINRSTIARLREGEDLSDSDFIWLCPKTDIDLKDFGQNRAHSYQSD